MAGNKYQTVKNTKRKKTKYSKSEKINGFAFYSDQNHRKNAAVNHFDLQNPIISLMIGH
jgi:hypothetical protein